MRKYVIINLMLVLLLAGCSVTGSLHRHGYNAKVIHTPKPVRVEQKKDSMPQYYEFKHLNGRPTEYFVPTTTLENGEQVMYMQIAEVTVVAKSRTLPERLGKVTIDFVVTLPRSLQGSCRSIAVAPVLHNQGKDTPLQELTIRGAFFSKVQEREYWQYDRYVDVYDPDSLQAMRAFERFVRFPYPEGVRLDSVVVHAADVSYYYTQEISTAEAGKRMLITLQGRVVGLDDSYYPLPPSDTLQYNISSMLTFADTTTRFVERIIQKYAVVQDRNYLSFRVNNTQIIDSLGDNASQLSRIEGLMDRLVHQDEFYVDSIVLTASSSPEGSYARNAQLSRERAHALRDRLVKRLVGSGVDTLITVRTIPEQWIELAAMIASDEQIASREKILSLWKQYPDPDRRENELRRLYPEQYKYIREKLYPLLRSVSFKYHLRRVGMIQDTIRTTEPDTLYARGVELMSQRRYTEALRILSLYNDRNTAITLLSLGYDDTALDILVTLPEQARTWYLRAIALARLGRRDEALEAYDRSVALDEHIEYRAGLDPELNDLLKNR